MLYIPTSFNGNAYNTFKANVDGVGVSFRFLWNEQAGAWFCDFESVNGANYGVKIMAGRQILAGSNKVIKGGDFVFLKTELAATMPLDFDNIGEAYKLYFVNDEDLDTLKAAGVI